MSRKDLASRIIALQSPSSSDRKLSPDFRAVLHELEVSQIELEVQNRELRESRQAVDLSHDRYIDLYDFAPVGYVTLDSKGIIREVNLLAADLLGSQRNHLIGRAMAGKVAEADRKKFRDYLANVPHNEKNFKTEIVIVRANSNIQIQLVTSKTRDRVTGDIFFRTVITDLTEQKRAEVELKREKERADQANQTKSAFLANMSHEIRTPLAAILGFTDLIKSSDSLAERSHYSEIVSRNGWALTKLIDDILDLTKVEAGRLQLERVDFNIEELVQEIVLLFRHPGQKKNLKFCVNIDSETPELINSDPTRIRQILINLIGNAVKFTMRGSISIRVEPLIKRDSMTCVRFIVTDTGIGLTEDQVAKLFEPFSQADSSTTRKYGGSGLGLTLSRRLAQALGGDITLDAFTPGKGCTFVASVEAIPAICIAAAMRKPASTPPTTKFKRQAKILLVEDSKDNQEYIRLVLLKAGMLVDVADNGAEGVRLAEIHYYDVVLMDMQMPVLDGYEATKRLRLDGYDRPIVALTAHAMTEDRRRSLEIGCDAHLTKPLDSKLLVATIARLQA